MISITIMKCYILVMLSSLPTDLLAPRRLCCQAPLLPVYTSLSGPVTELFLTMRRENIIRKHELLELKMPSGLWVIKWNLLCHVAPPNLWVILLADCCLRKLPLDCCLVTLARLDCLGKVLKCCHHYLS